MLQLDLERNVQTRWLCDSDSDSDSERRLSPLAGPLSHEGFSYPSKSVIDLPKKISAALSSRLHFSTDMSEL